MKNFFRIIIFIFVYSIFIQAQADRVEDVFSDINSDYKYLTELQSLYDAWVITPDKNWRFNPLSLLKRDDFTSMVMELKCEDCKQPSVSAKLLHQYHNSTPFFDVSKDNKNFYCIAKALDDGVVKGYSDWHKCENWVSDPNQTPFCPENYITLEEAIAIILRHSPIFVDYDMKKNDKYIYDDLIYSSSFYPYVITALETSIKYYDRDLNEKTLRLLEPSDNKNLWLKQNITREYFLKMSYFFQKVTWWCEFSDSREKDFTLGINVCNPDADLCDKIDISWDVNRYAFESKVVNFCPEGIDSYLWYIVNKETLEYTTYNKKNIDNHEFWDWIYEVRLIVIDKCWGISESSMELWRFWNIDNKEDKFYWVNIESVLPKIWPANFDFVPIVEWFSDNAQYFWDFWDWNTSNQKYPSNFFDVWTYFVELTVRENWIERKANIVIESLSEDDFDDLDKLLDKLEELKEKTDDEGIKNIIDKINQINNKNLLDKTKDTDWDWIPDYIDKCPFIPWVKENDWCPILDNKCSDDELKPCNNWYTCNFNTWYCEAKSMKNHKLYWTCNFPSSLSGIFWNLYSDNLCSNYRLEFNATLRKCDIVFPVITSNDDSKVFSRWSFFQIPEE